MSRRFQFSLGRLFRWTTCTALTLGAVLAFMRLASSGPSTLDSGIGLLWLALVVTIVAAAVGAVSDDSLMRGLLVGAGVGLTIFTMLVLSCSKIR